MKVKVFTEGGKDIGYGHLSRCFALYEEIKSRGNEVELIVQGDLEENELFENANYKNENWLDFDYLNRRVTNQDYVIVDSYLAGNEHYELIASNSSKALYIDDIGRIHYPKGIIVNPAFDSACIDYSYATPKSVLTGSEYIIIRSAFTQANRKTVIQKAVSRVLIIIGGTDIRDITSNIIQSICIRNQNIFFDVVISPSQHEKISSQNELKNVNYHKTLSAKEMSQIMNSADLAISAAGQTMYELIFTRTPFIAIQVAQNQQNNINSLLKNIPSQIALKYDEENFVNKLQDRFKQIRDYNFRKEIAKDMKDIIDGNGKTRIIDALLNKSSMSDEIRLREVQEQDIKAVFDLSNKADVRQYSLNQNKILWNDHVKWFNNVLNDNHVIFHVVTDEANSFLGQIRYKVEDNSATVSISISDTLRGRGLSKNILSQSINGVFKENPNINEIIAIVLEKNVASMKLFTGLNFSVIDRNDGIIKFTLRRNKYDAD